MAKGKLKTFEGVLRERIWFESLISCPLKRKNSIGSQKMQLNPHNHTIDSKYLNQMRDLVLRVTANLDCTIFLFGSRASGVHRRSSDIDIGFSGLSESVFTKTRDCLLSELEESVIPHHVDLVNIDTAPSDFRDVAMKEVIIWKRSSRAN